MPSKCSIVLEISSNSQNCFRSFFLRKLKKNIHVNITSKCNILFWKKQIFRSAIIGNISGHDLCSKNGFGIQKSIENFFRPNRIQNFSEIVLDLFLAKILDRLHYWPRFMPSKWNLVFKKCFRILPYYFFREKFCPNQNKSYFFENFGFKFEQNFRSGMINHILVYVLWPPNVILKLLFLFDLKFFLKKNLRIIL